MYSNMKASHSLLKEAYFVNKVLLEKHEHIAILKLNNPSVLNVLNTEMMEDIDQAVDLVNLDEDIYVLIIIGEGKGFIAGADISEMFPLSPVRALEWGQLGSKLNSKIEDLRIPVIAAINGYALGGGCELALACDIRIASEKAKFGQPEASLGITTGAGGTQRLPRIVGVGKAKELLFTGRVIDAEEALAINLVNKVVPHDELLNEALAMANQIAYKNARIAVQEIKKAVTKGMNMDKDSALAYELQLFSLCFSTEDQKFAMEAFMNKKKVDKYIGK